MLLEFNIDYHFLFITLHHLLWLRFRKPQKVYKNSINFIISFKNLSLQIILFQGLKFTFMKIATLLEKYQ